MVISLILWGVAIFPFVTMLGTRISDTLTLQQDCLYKENGQDMIRIFQPKTRMYVKPVSSELAQLIRKAIEHRVQKYGKRKYIFVDDKYPNKRCSTTQYKGKYLH